jgi:hypothetical protein
VRRTVAIWIAVLVLAAPVLAGVHSLRLGDGRLISGQLVRATAETLWFRPSGDTTVVQFSLTDVVSIRFGTGSTAVAEREPVTAEVGTRLRVALEGPLGTYSSNAGDTFAGTMVSELSIAGEVLVPAGNRVKGRVRKVVRPPAKGQRAVIEVVLTSVTVAGAPVPVITDHFGIETDGAGGVRTNGAAGIEGVSLLMLTDGKDLNLRIGTVLVFHLTQPMTVR